MTRVRAYDVDIFVRRWRALYMAVVDRPAKSR